MTAFPRCRQIWGVNFKDSQSFTFTALQGDLVTVKPVAKPRWLCNHFYDSQRQLDSSGYCPNTKCMPQSHYSIVSFIISLQHNIWYIFLVNAITQHFSNYSFKMTVLHFCTDSVLVGSVWEISLYMDADFLLVIGSLKQRCNSLVTPAGVNTSVY